VIEQQHYSGTDSYTFDDCGFTLNGESEFYGQMLLRVDKGGQAFPAKDTLFAVSTEEHRRRGGLHLRGFTADDAIRLRLRR